MALTPGTHIGTYVVIGQIGAGGMGEVYRARDLRLNRDVAVKILPDVFCDDEERLTRFEREAQLLASLNHRNIAQVHGVEDIGARRVLIMELVEGETLPYIVTPADDPRRSSRPMAAGSRTRAVHRPHKCSSRRFRIP